MQNESRSESIKQPDGYKLNLFFYPSSSEDILGCILFLPDMRDHHDRYEDFFATLNNYGYNVYTYDYRGHGKSNSVSELGHIAQKNGHKLLLNDLVSVSKKIENDNPDSNKFIIGIGMGSILVNCLLASDEAFWDGVCLISPYYKSSISVTGKLLSLSLGTAVSASGQASIKATDNFFNTKSYHSFGNRTSFDWISQDNTQVGLYIHDPFCGFNCTPSFFIDFYRLYKLSTISFGRFKLQKSSSVLIISGANDPFSNMGNAVNKIFNSYKENGYNNIRKIVYKGLRHDLFHEKDYKLVYEDILRWLNPNLIIEHADFPAS